MNQLKKNNIAARLKHRIAFERPIYTFDALAARETTWEKTEEAWADIVSLSVKERELSDRLIHSASYRIYVRNHHNVQPDMHIAFGHKILSIRAIINNPRFKELIEIMAEEENS